MMGFKIFCEVFVVAFVGLFILWAFAELVHWLFKRLDEYDSDLVLPTMFWFAIAVATVATVFRRHWYR